MMRVILRPFFEICNAENLIAPVAGAYIVLKFLLWLFSDLSQYNSAAAVICVRFWVLLCTYFSTYHDQASTGFFFKGDIKECLLNLQRRGSTVQPNVVS